ncbi:hypothetical protein DMP23_47655 [Amycolatopsis sp. A1MSW2902]|uniref:hypothetical protein n=1 Tax=Amycolatopsis sp. A1MSW2902 TaxID=687413 RepID=UPI00307EF4FE
MDLIRDEPQWTFTGFPGFGAQHLRVWRAPGGVLVAVVIEVQGIDDENIYGTDLIEGHDLVFAQLQADHPGERIDYIHCERRLTLAFDVFSRITFKRDGTHCSVLDTNDVIDHLGVDNLYRRYRGEVFGTIEPPRRAPGDPHRMPGC